MNPSPDTPVVESAPRPFLESVARAYAETFDDLSDFCFVFPNKRSGTFFLKHLRDAAGSRTLLAPQITSIQNFVAYLADRDVASRVDLLFRLFNIYRNTREKPEEEDFDKFRGWGEILLSDFSEVDQYNVDADSLFKNVKDYREIASNFLSEEQIEVMERYFGYTPSPGDMEGFWKNLQPPSDIKDKFLYLWQQMAPLYHALNESLEAEELSTSGASYRIALERLREHGRDIIPFRKVVLVGFNALSTTEALIFEELRSLDSDEDIDGQYAEFFWDGTGPVLAEAVNDAATFLKYNRRNFPQPVWAARWMERSETRELPPNITVVSAPSNSAQGKIAGKKVEELLEEFGSENIQGARAAVVLPDENLLMPLLYALPDELTTVNLTMGYPLKSTSVMSFIHHLRGLRVGARRSGGETAYFHEDLRLFLAHPFVHALIGSRTVSKINGYINRHHRITLKVSELVELNEELGYILRELESEHSAEGIINYIDDVLVRVSAALEGKEEGLLKSRLDRSNVEVYRDALRRLLTACRQHKVEMGVAGIFAMADKLLAGEKVTFEGEPLEGLQVMGLLETRAIDFDHLVILSMNDSVMPRKASARTFIPDSLRHGFGLPYSNYREDLFAYYFYRMISRARDVTLIYDARASDGMRSGGMSRYLMQMKYLYARDKMKFENHKYLLNPVSPKLTGVEKNKFVAEQLNEFTIAGSERNFSASALKNYFICPVKFYYENVYGIKTDRQTSPYIDAIDQGSILHEVIFHLYFPEGKRRIYLKNPIEMTPEKLDALMADREGIRAEVRRAVNNVHFHKEENALDTPLDGSAAIIAAQIEEQVYDILRYDRRIAPFRLVGGEISGLVEWPLDDSGRKVNMKYAIDRLDLVKDENGKEHYRIVDYKTGDAKVDAGSIDEIFDGTPEAQNFFQIMLYANLMNKDLKREEPVRLAIYEISSLRRRGEKTPTMKYLPEGKKVRETRPLADHLQENEPFLARTQEVLQEIFDLSINFEPVDDDEKCRYCKLSQLCGRHK